MRGLSDLNNNSGGGGGSAGGQGGGGCSDCILGMWNNTPFWTRFLFASCTIIYLLSWVSEYVLYFLFCSPPLIIYNFQIWRLFTGLFVHPQLLTLLFAMMSHLPHAGNAEREIGTIRYFCRFWMLGFFTLLLFTIVCGVSGMNQMSIGLWPMLFVDLVIECMANPEQTQGLCCLPIQIKRKWYPLILLVIFSLFFFQLSMWFGFAMGYAYHYGLFKRIDCGANRATQLESKFPFKYVSQKPYFKTAGDACGGTIMPGTSSGGFLGGLRGGSSAQETSADNESGTAAASSNSMAAGFKAFSGKGTSIGGAPVSAEPPRIPNTGASASRGRSTPATRAASAASSSSSAAGDAARPGNALIAKLEEKKRMESLGDDSALTTTDVGHDMEPQDDQLVNAAPDKEDTGFYGQVKDADSSI